MCMFGDAGADSMKRTCTMPAERGLRAWFRRTAASKRTYTLVTV